MQLYKAQKVLIFGLGLNQGGVGSAQFFAKNGAQVRITDLKNENDLQPSLKLLKGFKDISYTLGKHTYEDIDWADLVVKNPAIKPRNPFMEYAKTKDKQVETDMGIFLQFVKPNQLIGVTGTKGKSTTASLIYETLKKSLGVNVIHPPGELASHLGKNVILAGNIGKSVLDTIPDINNNTLVVLEISSFQLEAFEAHKVSPKWAVITNISPDHLNYYQTMDEYIAAKKIIGKYQTSDDFLFIRKDDKVVDQPNFLDGYKAQVIRFSSSDLPEDFKPNLLGSHNLDNIAAAYQVSKTFKIEDNVILHALENFNGVPFRMELVKQWNGFKIYNDTAATIPAATIQALLALGPNVVLICGGMNKKLDYQQLSKAIDQNAIAVYFLEGDVVDEITKNMKYPSLIKGIFNDLTQLLLKVKADLPSNPDLHKKVILFSPGATSFNLFQNEFDRGRKFNEAIRKVFADV